MINARQIAPPADTLDPRTYERAIKTALGIAETAGLQEMRSYVRSWKKKPAFRIERKGDESAVVTNDEVFGYQDRGTKRHVIRPRSKRFLRFTPKGGGTVFAKKVNHPGTPAQRFSERAAAAVQKQFQRVMAEELRKAAP